MNNSFCILLIICITIFFFIFEDIICTLFYIIYIILYYCVSECYVFKLLHYIRACAHRGEGEGIMSPLPFLAHFCHSIPKILYYDKATNVYII